MTEDEKRSYQREQYRKQKEMIQGEDHVEQRQNWSSKKRSERDKQKQTDPEKYKESRALERFIQDKDHVGGKKIKDMTDDERRNYQREQYRKQKEMIQGEDHVEQRQNWSSKKRSERDKQKQTDPEKYKESRALEKANERNKKIQTDPEKYNESRALERANERNNKNTV